jgi:hypothetical protein
MLELQSAIRMSTAWELHALLLEDVRQTIEKVQKPQRNRSFSEPVQFLQQHKIKPKPELALPTL